MMIVHAVCTKAFAGVERHIAMLAAAQADAGHTVIVVGGDPALMRTGIHRDTVRHIQAATIFQTARVLDRFHDADVFNVHMTAAELAVALALRVRKVPAVSTRHFASPRGSSSGLAAWVSRRIARRISAQVAVSGYVADHIESPSHVVVSGVPAQADGLPAARRTRTVLVAQRLEREKRTEDAIRAFASSGIASHGWRLEIAGEGAQRGYLEELVGRLELTDSVEFLGLRQDIAARMRASALLLAPCDVDALGLSVLEAMSFGLPVVAADAGGHIETLGTVAHELCYPPGDVVESGRLLAALAEDPAKRDKVGTRLREGQRARFTVTAQAEATELVYRSVL